jgi:eukaryotic-like serine/threonine-protein kinase
MRNLFRIFFRVLILATVFLASALMAMRLAIHGREVAVPKVTGMTAAQAERIAVSHGLLLETESRFYSAEVPENRILSQLPALGEKVRRGTHLRVALSLGPQKIAIPNVIGESQRAAEMNIRRRGLEIGSLAVASLPGFPPDQVLSQSPPPNSPAAASPRINLLVSAAQDDSANLYYVPDFVGHTLDEATQAIASSPMKLGTVSTVKETKVATASSAQPQPKVPKKDPVVASQTPAAGQRIPAGTAINFEVRR